MYIPFCFLWNIITVAMIHTVTHMTTNNPPMEPLIALMITIFEDGCVLDGDTCNIVLDIVAATKDAAVNTAFQNGMKCSLYIEYFII